MQIKVWVTFPTDTGTLYNTCRTWRNPYRSFLNLFITTNLPFGVFFTIFHDFYQNSKLLKLIQNTLDVLLIIIHNLSLYTEMISVIFHPWKIKYPQQNPKKPDRERFHDDYGVVQVLVDGCLALLIVTWHIHPFL